MIFAPALIGPGRCSLGFDCAPHGLSGAPDATSTPAPVLPSSRSRSGPITVLLRGFFLLVLAAASLQAQTIDDGIMMPKKQLFTGTTYTYDTWSRYWEGGLKRTNGNIGTITTQSATWSGNYGITDRLNFLVQVPYVWTRATQGVLHSMKGLQDFTMAAKFKFYETPFTKYGRLRAFAVGSASLPLTDYTPDFFPLSIGTASNRVASRLTLNFQSNAGWFLNGSGAYTWRDNVTLNRPSYFTNDTLFLTNQVQMPNVFDYTFNAGYLKKGRLAEFIFTQQKTKGGGDIRRQDVPFVSNKMDFSKVGGTVMYPLPFRMTKNMAFQFLYTYVVDGRNVGQSSTFSTGFFYTLNFSGRQTQ